MRLSDQNGRLKSFKNTIIISTTNVGADVYSEIAPVFERSWIIYSNGFVKIQGVDFESVT